MNTEAMNCTRDGVNSYICLVFYCKILVLHCNIPVQVANYWVDKQAGVGMSESTRVTQDIQR